MISSSLAKLTESAEVHEAMVTVDSLRIAEELGGERTLPDGWSLPRLRVAAMLSIADLLDGQLEEIVRDSADELLQSNDENQIPVFRKWLAYLNSARSSSTALSIDDLLFFAAAGLLAERPVEVRSVLRQHQLRKNLESACSPSGNDWKALVRSKITAAIVYLVIQEDHLDLQKAAQLIGEIADAQAKFEAAWLNSKADAGRDAITLLGYYHLAQAVTRTSEFLLVGSLEKDGRVVHDFGPELGRLLVKSEEYF